MKNIYAIVVTYNRKISLKKCIEQLNSQTYKIKQILIINNNSTDGTSELLNDLKNTDNKIEIIELNENIGGSGGFCLGIKQAIDNGADWVWIMDDDAIPESQALEKLIRHASDDFNIYGSIAIDNGQKVAWRLEKISINNKKDEIKDIINSPETLEVAFLPFLGMLISRRLVQSIGLPDAEFFLAADDVDFCLRTRAAGGKIIAVTKSHVHHPAAEVYPLQLPWRKLWLLRLPPWKRYYDTRNRILVAYNHFGLALYYQTLPSLFLRLIGSLVHEDHRLDQTKAFFAGVVDGLRGKKGRRHELWGL